MKKFLYIFLALAPLSIASAGQDSSSQLDQYLQNNPAAEALIDFAAVITEITPDECIDFVRACRQEAAASCGAAGVKSVRAICSTGECSWECNIQVEPVDP